MSTNSFRYQALKSIFVCFGILFFSIPAVNADDSMRWSVKGFGTLGLTSTDSDDLGFKRSSSQTKAVTNTWRTSTDSRLGLQLSVDISPSWSATVQWVARDHAGDVLEQNLDWAFFRWNMDNDRSLRFGRLGADLFLLSDYRNVGYAYSWIRPPHEFYSNLALYHFDGIDYTHKIHFGNDTLSVKVFAGYSFNQIPSAFSEPVDLESPLAGGSLKFESGNWTTRAGYAYLRLVSDVPNEQLVDALNDPLVGFGLPGISSLIPHLSLEDTNVHYYSLGAAYDDGSWVSQAEISYVDSETTFFPDTTSAYLSIGKRISNVTVYSLFGISRSSQKDVEIPSPVIPLPQLQQLQQVVDRAINKNGVDEKSISLGARWDVYRNIALKAQWSHYWLGENGTQFWDDPSSKDKSEQVDVWSVGVDFIF